MLVLDSGGVSALSRETRQTVALVHALRQHELWPPTVPSLVLVECLQGHSGRDARANRLLKTCDIAEEVSEQTARRAAFLRQRAGRGSAVDALVVAFAEPGGTVLTSDPGDIHAIAQHADGVVVESI
jgi:hypothetical protein